MKVKEYLWKYINEYQEEDNYYRVVKAFYDMFIEVKEIQKARNTKSDAGLIAIFNEQNRKANSFIRKVNEIDDLGLKRDEFKHFIKVQMPELYRMIGWNVSD